MKRVENRKTFLEHKIVCSEIHTFITYLRGKCFSLLPLLSKNTISNVLLYGHFWKFYIITETIMHYLQYQEHRDI